jgi:hypothetical protein
MTRASGPVQVFDPALLRARLRRAARQGGANFLMQGLTDDLLDRLSMVRRNFENVVDAGSPDDIRPRLRTLLPEARLFRISAVVPVNEEADSDQYVTGNEMLPTLPVPVDLVVSLLAFQTVNDLPGILVQIARALQPDGLLIAALLGGKTLHELRTAFTIAESDLTGGASPRVSPFADVRDMGALLQRAGFALPVADSETITVRYADPVGLLRDLRAMGGTSILTERLHTPMRRELLTRAMDVYRRDFSDPDGRVRATFEIIWISGWRPHESQQKPLKPGSALARLTDVLPTKTYD